MDYYIVSEMLLEDILYMQVSEFTPLSDCHCKNFMKMLSSFQREYYKENKTHVLERYKWINFNSRELSKSFFTCSH